MKYLLDTHAFIWWLMDSPKLPGDWGDLFANPESDIAVSTVSILEIAIKEQTGKIALDEIIDLNNVIRTTGFDELVLTSSHAVTSARLPFHHRDPFDRLLIAQSIEENRILVTQDGKIPKYDVQVLG